MASSPSQRFVLTLACANRPGIVAAVAGHLSDAGLNILDAQQYDDTQTDRFFMRVVFDPVSGKSDLDALKSGFTPLAERLGMSWTLRDPSQKRRVMLLVSKFDHCLADLLYRWRIGELDFEPAGVIANHPAETYRPCGPRRHSVPLSSGHQGHEDGAGDAESGRSSAIPRPISWCSRATCRCCRTVSPRSLPGAASTSTTPSFPASRAPSPITRPMPAG